MHIPKTAGMTIRQALRSAYADDEWMPAEQWRDMHLVDRPLASYKLFQGHFRYFFREMIPPDVKVFTFLREPVDRAISHLLHLSEDPAFNSLHDIAYGTDLRTLIENPQIRHFCCNNQVGYLSDPLQPVSLETMLNNPDSEDEIAGPADVQTALDHIGQLSYVGFMDNIANDIRHIAAMLDLHPPQNLQMFNSAQQRGSRVEVSSELREMIADANSLDCEFYAIARRRHLNTFDAPERKAAIQAMVDRGVYPRIRAATRLLMGQPLPASGLWSAEGPLEHRYRWTGPERDLSFELGLDACRNYVLELTIDSPLNPGLLQAFVNDRPVDIRLVALNGGTAVIAISVEPRPGPSVTTITIQCETTAPAGAADSRALGFVLRDAVIKPV